MNSIEQICVELAELGLVPKVLKIEGLGGGQAAAFNYQVKTGRHKGQTFSVGIAFQEAGYPEYAPHFIWVAGLTEPSQPAHSTAACEHESWQAFSVPPNDFWDRLPSAEKNMKTYMRRHMQRFWDQV